MTEQTKIKKVKKKGPIRFEAIIPVLVLSGLTFGYFKIYFDRNLKSLIEYVGTQGNGAEVNVGSIHTSFFKGSFDLNDLQITNVDRPNLNSIEIANIHFQFLWDALLRMKFVVNDASINNIQMLKPRKTPGKVLPPEPAKPSALDKMQLEVMAQVKTKYGSNMLGDLVTILEGGDYKDQIQTIRESLKSEIRVKEMIKDVEGKKEFWDGKVKTLSDTTKLKSIETQVNAISKEKNFLEQAKGVQQLTKLLNEVNDQYKEIQSATKQLQSEITAITKYPTELQNLVNEDINSIKGRFSIPQIDLKDMAMHLFAGQFAEYIVKARKYQALAKQYLPEKKEREEEVIPQKRSEGKNYQFSITTGYPLFWLQRAALSSSGTAETYSGNVSGELTNVTTSPKQIKKPIVLDMRGDFPGVQIMGVQAKITADFTQDIGKQSALIQVKSFQVPQKMFVENDKLKFGFTQAIGTSTINAQLIENQIKMDWIAALNHPKFAVESKNKLATEMLNNIVNAIPMINIKGDVKGTFTKFDMNISSNLGDEISNGFKRELNAKVSEAQNKIQSLVDEKINKPKQELMSKLGGNINNLKDLGNLAELYKKNEARIKEEIEKLKKGGTNDLKEKGKNLLKGIKF